jgi:bleomycin hydrolase
MKKFKLLFPFILFVFSAFSQTITPEDFAKIKKSYISDNADTKALTNAVSNNKINDLALNRQNVGKFDKEFKYKVKVKGITDQKQSGRCWMYTSLNVMRPKAIAQLGTATFEFSENYLYFYDILEKSNLFLEGIIETAGLPIDDRKVDWLFDNAVGDGGVWSSYVNLVQKYGLVPKDIMPDTKNSENTKTVVSVINRKLREDGMILREMSMQKKLISEIRKSKNEMLGDVYKILAVSLGEPPTEFQWRSKNTKDELSEYKTYTPVSFMKEVLGDLNLDDYIMLMDDPTRPYYKLYEIEKDRNVMEGRNWKYINIPASEIKPFALQSIKENEACYFSCDVSKQLNSDEGLLDIENYDYESLYGVKFGMNKQQRILSHDSGSTHGMALVGADTDETGKVTKWLLENSWGATSGANGYLIMTDRWFDLYMFRVVVLKKYIDAKTLEILNQKPVMLPPWDPMFLSEE